MLSTHSSQCTLGSRTRHVHGLAELLQPAFRLVLLDSDVKTDAVTRFLTRFFSAKQTLAMPFYFHNEIEPLLVKLISDFCVEIARNRAYFEIALKSHEIARNRTCR